MSLNCNYGVKAYHVNRNYLEIQHLIFIYNQGFEYQKIALFVKLTLVIITVQKQDFHTIMSKSLIFDK